MPPLLLLVHLTAGTAVAGSGHIHGGVPPGYRCLLRQNGGEASEIRRCELFLKLPMHAHVQCGPSEPEEAPCLVSLGRFFIRTPWTRLALQARLKELDSDVVRKWPRCSVLKRRMYSDIRVRGTVNISGPPSLRATGVPTPLPSRQACFSPDAGIRSARCTQMDNAQLSALGGVWAAFLFVGGLVASLAGFALFMCVRVTLAASVRGSFSLCVCDSCKPAVSLSLALRRLDDPVLPETLVAGLTVLGLGVGAVAARSLFSVSTGAPKSLPSARLHASANPRPDVALALRR